MLVKSGKAASDHSTKWPFLDLVRSGAALLVVLGHARGYYWPEYSQLSAPGPFTNAFYLLTGLQHEGVVLFFLVSGFLVGGSAWEAFAEGRFVALRYFSNRFVRIYLVLIPGLVLTLAIYAIGVTWFANTPAIAALPPQPWSWETGVCHLASLQGISCSVMVPNAALWSLAYEWVLYLAAPVVFAVYHARIELPWRLVGLLLLGVTFVSLMPAHLQWSWVLFWFMGTGAAVLSARYPLKSWFGAAGLFAMLCGLVISRLHVVSSATTDLMIAVAFAVALATPAVLRTEVFPYVMSRFADLSYSLYVIHLPVITLTVALLQKLSGPTVLVASVGSALLFSGTVAIAVVAAAAFAHVTERHTRRIQRAIIATGSGEA